MKKISKGWAIFWVIVAAILSIGATYVGCNWDKITNKTDDNTNDTQINQPAPEVENQNIEITLI